MMLLMLTDSRFAHAAVGVMDGPINCAHQEWGSFAGNCKSFFYKDFVPHRQISLHGTHVTSIINGKRIGVYKGARVVGYQMFYMHGTRGPYTWLGDNRVGNITLEESAIIHGYHHMGVTVFNQSYGRGAGWTPAKAVQLWNKYNKVTFTRAAGNSGVSLQVDGGRIPDNVIMVGAVDGNNRRTSWSNYPGERYKYDFVMAPGIVRGADEHNGYIVMMGTSMAAPYVAGVVAELHDRYPQYRGNPRATKRVILTTATDLGTPGVDAEYGYGLVNRNKAVLTLGKKVYTPPVVVPDRKAPHVTIGHDRFAMQFVPGVDGELGIPNMRYSFNDELSLNYLDGEVPALQFHKKGLTLSLAYSKVEDQPEVYYSPMLSAGVNYFKEWDISKTSQLAFDAEIPMFTFDGYASWDDDRIDYAETPTYRMMLKWKGTFN